SPTLDWRPLTVAPAPAASRATPEPAPQDDRRLLVGREQELEQLLSALDASARGSGRLALLAGEPGIGKTRLAEELADVAARRDIQVAWGHCHDAEAAPAYWPWAEIVRVLADGRDPSAVRAALGAGAAEVVQIVPELKEVVGGDLAPVDALEPEAARARLYEAVIGFVLRLAEDQALALVVDDLHWADAPSLQLVRLLAAQLTSAAILLVCTYREAEADTTDPVLAALASLARVPNVVRVRPRGLDDQDVARLVSSASGVDPPPGVAEAICDRTEGNPFFVSELVRLLGSERQLRAEEVVRREIPAGVRDVIRLRLARLPDDAVALLGVAAVIGRDFDLDVLVAAADLDDERALELVEAALLAGVVIEDEAAVGHYRFSHALVRDTVYDGISGVRRPRLHRRVAAALQGFGAADDARVFEIARHLYAAAPVGAAGEAFDWAVRAADRAMARLAFEDAEDELRRAVSLVGRLPAGPDAIRRELAAQVQLGAVMFMTKGYSEPAVGEAWSRARELCREVPDAPELLPTLWGLWAFTCVRADFPLALELAGELLQHGERTGNTLFSVIGHETTGVTLWHQGHLREAREHLGAGAALCDTLPPELFTGALLEKHPGVACRSFAGVVAWLLGDEQGAVALSRDGLVLARHLAHPFSVVFALFFAAWLDVLRGDRAGVVVRADEGVDLARRHGFQQYVAMLEILRAWATDDGVTMERAFADYLDTGSRMLQHFYLGLMAEVQRRMGRVDDARRTVERALAEGDAVGERFWRPELERLRTELAPVDAKRR
ncbi:MAG: ATP-binding protein, partial [Acidimicrobiales bacterium]